MALDAHPVSPHEGLQAPGPSLHRMPHLHPLRPPTVPTRSPPLPPNTTPIESYLVVLLEDLAEALLVDLEVFLDGGEEGERKI